MRIINEDQYDSLVVYEPGRCTLARENMGTRYVALVFRAFMDSNGPQDMAAASQPAGAALRSRMRSTTPAPSSRMTAALRAY